ncbi:MAG: cisplatin damage response ATP-dependent DNA ligase [Pseudomonadota bacterium]
MTPFARLLTGLVFTPSRNAKLTLLRNYFSTAPDPDRGWALAAIAGEMDLRAVQPSIIRALVEERVDPVLFRLSYDYVGDLAETVSLIWPTEDEGTAKPIRLGDVVDALAAASRSDTPALLARLLDRLPSDERFALIKLATGGLRVGVSARLAKTALAEWAAEQGLEIGVEQIEELWHGLEPPYVPLFRWLSGEAPAPEVDLALAFRPMMLAHPIDAALYSAEELKINTESEAETRTRLDAKLAPGEFAAEWKWDGIRVQAIATDTGRRLYSRTGEEISGAFPDVLEAMTWRGAVDGELLVVRDGAVAPFADLQKRLGRKTVSAKMLRDFPAHIRAYDLLHDGQSDLRPLALTERRRALEAWMAANTAERLDLSPAIAFNRWEDLADIRAGARDAAQEGVMLKRWDAAYVGGRPMGPWFKWKRDPLSADCVLMYAQRGHGKRSSFYSDYTFGAWRDGAEGAELTPVGKAYSGYTDEELAKLDRWIRNNTTDRYGPVRAVTPALVFEVAFDAVQASTRHKSGVAMRFPRIKRIRWDKPAHEADRLETLERMIVGSGG